MENPDYDIVPHNEIFNLKQEIDELKNATSSDMQKAMHELTDSINNMNSILKEASVGMKTEENEALRLTKKFDSLIDAIKITIDENKKIAESMISLAELIKKRLPLQDQHKPESSPSGMMPPMASHQQLNKFSFPELGSLSNMPPPRAAPGIQTPSRHNPFQRENPPIMPFVDEQGPKKRLFGKLRK